MTRTVMALTLFLACACAGCALPPDTGIYQAGDKVGVCWNGNDVLTWTAPPADHAAQLAARDQLEATADRAELTVTRLERDVARLTIHDWTTTEQPDGPVTWCVDCGRSHEKGGGR